MDELMKCMYRKVIRYEKTVKKKAQRDNGGNDIRESVEPCAKNDATAIIEEYADCYGEECPAYADEVCLRAADTLYPDEEGAY